MSGDGLQFPEGFLWGAATAAHQVEGGNTNNQWAVLGAAARTHLARRAVRARVQLVGRRQVRARPGPGAGTQHPPAVAGVEAHRAAGGPLRDPRAIARYRGLLEALRARGLKPAVTLHHFTDPLWLWDLGSWENGEAVQLLARFVERIISNLRDVVDLWCTINEPVVLAVMGYLAGIHPPGKRNPLAAVRVLRHLLLAHAAAYRVIRRLDSQAQAGIVHQMRLPEPARPGSRANRAISEVYDFAVNRLVLPRR